MQCDICFRTGSPGLPFLCPIDARNQLYQPRIEQARLLIEKDALDKEVSVITSRQTGLGAVSSHKDVNQYNLDSSPAETEAVVNRTAQIIEHADELRRRVQEARADIVRRKALMSQRKSDLASAKDVLDARRKGQLADVERKTKMVTYKWNQIHSTTAQSRAFLCGEAANLYGLRKSGSRDSGPDEYMIAGNKIIDLRALNSASAVQITSSFSNIAQLLVLTTHYLSIRLPAEITLPHRDYPLPTILSLASSYKNPKLPFPGASLVQSSSNSPTESRHGTVSNLPRLRPLFITKPLPMLATEDPGGYALFVEGATLLAYNIAWVCKSQGIAVGSAASNGTVSFGDMCLMGRNLFNLLIGSEPRPSPPSRVPSSQSTPTKSKTKPNGIAEGMDNLVSGEGKRTSSMAATVGHFSHGAAHSHLNSPAGNELMGTVKLLSPVKLADQLKGQLLSELASAEWEIVDSRAINEEADDEIDDGVMVGARRLSDVQGSVRGALGGALRGWSGGMAQSFMSMRTVMDAVELVNGDGERKPGTSGWTKLKSR